MFDKKTHWQNIYQSKSASDVSWYQMEPELSLSLIRNTGIASDELIIDIGGGASVLVDQLSEEGFSNVAVLDISENALHNAKERLGDASKNIKWFEADITQFVAPCPFSLWHDRAVFHFLTKQRDRKNYIRALKHALRPGGHFIIAAFSIGGPEKCSGLKIVQYDAGKLIAELGEDFQLQEERNETHMTPNHKKQQFTYFHFIRTSGSTKA